MTAPVRFRIRALVDLEVLDVGLDDVHPLPGLVVPGLAWIVEWVVIDPARQQPLVVVLAIHGRSEEELFDIAQATGLARSSASLGEYGEENRGEDGDDRDNDK